jgi:lipopolysaccharide transport system permease protein
MVLVPTGVGLWLSALAIRFRDVKFAMTFVIRMLMYSAPIVYSASTIPDSIRFYYSLNPLVAVIEGFRATILGSPMPWDYIWPGVVTAILLVISGLVYFRRMEKVFVDVI